MREEIDPLVTLDICALPFIDRREATRVPRLAALTRICHRFARQEQQFITKTDDEHF